MKSQNFALVLFLFTSGFLLSFTSGLKPNSLLETTKACQNDPDCTNMNAQCNTNRKCQCKFPYAPVSQGGEVLNACQLKSCSYDGVCTELYRDSNTTCSQTKCVCQQGFTFNEKRQQCEFGDAQVRSLGAICDQANQCGTGARCIFESGYCQCQFGFVPANNMTCKLASCDSDLQCRGRILPNSRCHEPNTPGSQCVCEENYTQDPNTNSCVPRARKIGQSCHDLDQRYRCGSNVICTGSVCRCFAGSMPMTNGLDCSVISCQKDLDCMASDINSVCTKGGCKCQSGYVLDGETQSCVKNRKMGVGWILLICFVGVAIVAGAGLVISKRVFGWKLPAKLSFRTK